MNLVDSPTFQNLDEETVLQALNAETNNWAVVTRKYCCSSIHLNRSTNSCNVESDCCQNFIG